MSFRQRKDSENLPPKPTAWAREYFFALKIWINELDHRKQIKIPKKSVGWLYSVDLEGDANISYKDDLAFRELRDIFKGILRRLNVILAEVPSVTGVDVSLFAKPNLPENIIRIPMLSQEGMAILSEILQTFLTTYANLYIVAQGTVQDEGLRAMNVMVNNFYSAAEKSNLTRGNFLKPALSVSTQDDNKVETLIFASANADAFGENVLQFVKFLYLRMLILLSLSDTTDPSKKESYACMFVKVYRVVYWVGSVGMLFFNREVANHFNFDKLQFQYDKSADNYKFSESALLKVYREVGSNNPLIKSAKEDVLMHIQKAYSNLCHAIVANKPSVFAKTLRDIIKGGDELVAMWDAYIIKHITPMPKRNYLLLANASFSVIDMNDRLQGIRSYKKILDEIEEKQVSLLDEQSSSALKH